MNKKMVSLLTVSAMAISMMPLSVFAEEDLITVGYAQVGAESDWRTANTESFYSSFTEENGYKLIFDDAQQKQENLI